MSTKNLLLLIDRVENGGAERALLRLAEQLKNEFDNIYLCSNFNSKKSFEYGELIYSNISEARSIKEKIISLIKYVLFVRKIKYEKNISHSISFLERSNIVNILTKRKCEKTVASVRNNLKLQYGKFNYIIRTVIRILISITYRKSQIVSLSETIKEQLESYLIFQTNVITIYNGYDFDAIKDCANKKIDVQYENDEINLVFVGRLSYQKNILNLVKAFKKVSDIRGKIKLWIFGEGELLPDLLELLIALNLEEKVNIMGVKDNIFPYIELADCFVFPSKYEGFGNALAEAVGLGKYVIAANCQYGPKEMLESQVDDNDIDINNSYILYPSNNNEKEDVDNIANALLKYLDGPVKYSDPEFSIKFREKFSTEKMKNRWLELLDV